MHVQNCEKLCRIAFFGRKFFDELKLSIKTFVNIGIILFFGKVNSLKSVEIKYWIKSSTFVIS